MFLILNMCTRFSCSTIRYLLPLSCSTQDYQDHCVIRLETQNIVFEDDDDGFLTVNAFSDQIHDDEKKEETKESPIESGTDSPERVQ